jgi:hypothetical protein
MGMLLVGRATTSDPSSNTVTKREAFEKCLADFYEVAVFVQEDLGADLPANVWRKNPDVSGRFCCLRYGVEQPKPIPDLEITDDGIRATLSFSCEPVKTFVPWDAVAGIVGDGERPKQRAQLRAV